MALWGASPQLLAGTQTQGHQLVVDGASHWEGVGAEMLYEPILKPSFSAVAV